MRYNRTRHKLLKKLAEIYLANREKTNVNADVVGLTFNQINSFLNINDSERELILSELVKNNEIAIFDLKEKGCFIEDTNGFISLTDRKYLKKNEEIIISWFKVFTQIVIPILSLSIATIVLLLKFNSITNNIEKKLNIKYKKELELIELKLDSTLQLVNSRKNNPISQKSKND